MFSKLSDKPQVGGFALRIAKNLVQIEASVVSALSKAINAFAQMCGVDISKIPLDEYLMVVLERAPPMTRLRVLTKIASMVPDTPAHDRVLKFFLLVELLWLGVQVIDAVVPLTQEALTFTAQGVASTDNGWAGAFASIMGGISPAVAYLLCRTSGFASKIRELTNVSSFIDRITRAITTLVEFVAARLGWVTKSLPDQVEKWSKLVDDIESVYEKSGDTVTNRELMAKDQKFRISLIRLLKEGKTLRQEFESLGQKDIAQLISQRMTRLSTLVKDSIGTYVGATGKVKPVCLYLFGRPGVGKTVMINYLMADVYQVLGTHFDPYMDRYTIDQTSPYFDTYAYQKVVDVQDFFQARDKASRLALTNNLMNMCDESACPMNIAECSGKGTVFFASEFVAITSNMAEHQLDHALAEVIEKPFAFKRRIDLWIKVERPTMDEVGFNRESMVFTVAVGPDEQAKVMSWNELVENVVRMRLKTPMRGALRNIAPAISAEEMARIRMNFPTWMAQGRKKDQPSSSQSTHDGSSVLANIPTMTFVTGNQQLVAVTSTTENGARVADASVDTVDLVKVAQPVQAPPPPPYQYTEEMATQWAMMMERLAATPPLGVSKKDWEERVAALPSSLSVPAPPAPVVPPHNMVSFVEDIDRRLNALRTKMDVACDGEEALISAALANDTSKVEVPAQGWREWAWGHVTRPYNYVYQTVSTLGMAARVRTSVMSVFAVVRKYLAYFVGMAGALIGAAILYKKLKDANALPEFLGEKRKNPSPQKSSSGERNDTFSDNRKGGLASPQHTYREYGSEAWLAPNMDIVNNTVAANLLWVTAGRSSSSAIGVLEQWVLVPEHVFLDVYRDSVTLETCRGGQVNFRMDDLKNRDVVIFKNRHLVAINLAPLNTHIPAFVSLSRYLLRTEDLPTRVARGSLFTLRPNTMRLGSRLTGPKYQPVQLLASDMQIDSRDITISQEKAVYHMEGGILYLAPTQVGDCGGALVVDIGSRAIIMGIHVGGAAQNQAVAAAFTSEMIDLLSCKVVEEKIPREPDIPVNGEGKVQWETVPLAPANISRRWPCSTYQARGVPVGPSLRSYCDQGILPLGRFFFGKRPFLPETSRLRPSAYTRVFGEGFLTAPAALKGRVEGDVELHPSSVFLDKFHFVRSFDHSLERRAVDWFFDFYRDLKPKFQEYDDLWENHGLPQKGGIGYPWYQYYKTRMDLIKDGTVLRNAAYDLMAQLRLGPVSCLVVDTPKDERRAHHKVAACETRFIYVMPLEFNVVARMLIGDLCDKMSDRHMSAPCKVGLNVIPSHWTALAESLRIEERPVIAGDFKGWDLGLPLSLLMENVEAMNRLYDDEYTAERTNLFLSMLTPTHIHYGHLFRTYQGLPSGMYGTSQLGSACSAEIVYMAMVANNFPTETLVVASFGDDHLATSETDFNQRHIKDFVDSVGMIYTDSSKSLDVQPYTPRDQVTFIKRYFVRHQREYWAPRALEEVREQLRWYRIREQVRECTPSVLRDIAYGAAYELVYHGRDVYRTYMRLMESVEPTVDMVPTWLQTYFEVSNVMLMGNVNNSADDQPGTSSPGKTVIDATPSSQTRGLTTFEDLGPHVEESCHPEFPLIDTAYQLNTGYTEMLNRQFKVYSGYLPLTSPSVAPILRMDPVGALFTNDYIRCRLEKSTFIRYTLDLELRIIATKFHYGTLMLVWRPAHLAGLGIYKMETDNNSYQWKAAPSGVQSMGPYDTVYTASQNPHVMVSVTAAESTTIKVHWDLPVQYAELIAVLSPRYHLGVLDMYALTPIGPSDMTAPGVMLYASLSSIQAFGYTHHNMTIKKKLASPGLDLGLLPLPVPGSFSSTTDLQVAPWTMPTTLSFQAQGDPVPIVPEFLTKPPQNPGQDSPSWVVKATGALGQVFTYLGQGFTWLASVLAPMGGWLASMGFSIPPVTVQPTAILDMVPNVVSTMGQDPSVAFAYNAANTLPIGSHPVQIDRLASVLTYLGYLKTSSELLNFSLPLDPRIVVAHGDAINMTPAGYILRSGPAYYRCGTLVRLVFTASGFNAARFAVSLIYRQWDVSVSAELETLAPTRVIDIVGDRVEDIAVPFHHPYAWKDFESNRPIAVLVIRQLCTVVTAESTSAQPIYISVFVSFPGLQVASTGTPHTTAPSLDGTVVVPLLYSGTPVREQELDDSWEDVNNSNRYDDHVDVRNLVLESYEPGWADMVFIYQNGHGHSMAQSTVRMGRGVYDLRRERHHRLYGDQVTLVSRGDYEYIDDESSIYPEFQPEPYDRIVITRHFHRMSTAMLNRIVRFCSRYYYLVDRSSLLIAPGDGRMIYLVWIENSYIHLGFGEYVRPECYCYRCLGTGGPLVYGPPGAGDLSFRAWMNFRFHNELPPVYLDELNVNQNSPVDPHVGKVQQDNLWGMNDCPSSLYHLAKRAVPLYLPENVSANTQINLWDVDSSSISWSSLHFFENLTTKAKRLAMMFRYWRTSYVLTRASQYITMVGTGRRPGMFNQVDSVSQMADAAPTQFDQAMIRIPFCSNASFLPTPISALSISGSDTVEVRSPYNAFAPQIHTNNLLMDTSVPYMIGAADDLEYRVFIGVPTLLDLTSAQYTRGKRQPSTNPPTQSGTLHAEGDSEVYAVAVTGTWSGSSGSVSATVTTALGAEADYQVEDYKAVSVSARTTAPEMDLTATGLTINSPASGVYSIDGTLNWTYRSGLTTSNDTTLFTIMMSMAAHVDAPPSGYTFSLSRKSASFDVKQPSGRTVKMTQRFDVTTGPPAVVLSLASGRVDPAATGRYTVAANVSLGFTYQWRTATPPTAITVTFHAVAQGRSTLSG